MTSRRKGVTRRQFLQQSAMAAGAAGLFTVLTPREGATQQWSLATAAQPYKGARLRVMSASAPYIEELKKQLPEFTKETGIEVRLETMSYQLFAQRGDMELSGGSSSYEAMMVIFTHVGRWVDVGWVQSLTPYIDNPKLTDKAALDLADYSQPAIRNYTRGKDLYALPYMSNSTLLMYRSDVFEKFGIKQPPATFDELMEVAQKIHTPEVAAFVSRGNPASPHLSYVWSNYCLGFGGRFFKNPPENLTPVLNSPQAIKAADYYATLMTKYGVPGSTNYAIDEAVQAMQQGKAAMTIDSIDVLSPIMVKEKSMVADKVKVAMIPKGPGGQFPIVVFHGFMIPKGSPNKEAAWLFIQWATSKDRMTKIATQSDGLGARDSVYSSAPIRKRFMWNGVDAGALMNQVQVLAAKENYMIFRQVTFFQAVGDRVGVAIQEIMAGKRPAKEAMDACNADLVNIVKRAGGKINEADLIRG
jgi:multiple sugar transport system substrate-binding protein